MSTRSEIIRIAASLPIGDPTRRALLAAAKSKTPEGAKKLYEQYLRGLSNPSKSKKKVTDFYDAKGGDEPAETETSYYNRIPYLTEHGEKKEKARSKGEKGERKTKERTEESQKQQEETKPETVGGARYKDRIRQMRRNVSKGREKAKKKLENISNADLRKEVERVLDELGKGDSFFRRENKNWDMSNPDDVKAALAQVQRGIDGIERRMHDQHAEYRSKPEKYESEDIAAGYAQGLLSKYQKVMGDKGEKAKRKTQVGETAKKHNLEDTDVSALRSFARGVQKKQKEMKSKKKDDDAFFQWAEKNYWSLDDEDKDRYNAISDRKEKGRTKSKAQLQAEAKKEFLLNADPETKKRVQQMTPAEFESMMAAIMDEEEVGGGKTGGLRTATLHLAASLPKGDSTRRKLLAALADKQAATRTEGAVYFFPDMDNGTVLIETQVHLPWMWKGGAAFGKELDAGAADNRTKFDSWLDKANQAIQALSPGHRTSISYYHNHDSVRTAQEKNVLIVKSEWSYKNPGSMYADEDAVRQALRESARKAGLAYDEA